MGKLSPQTDTGKHKQREKASCFAEICCLAIQFSMWLQTKIIILLFVILGLFCLNNQSGRLEPNPRARKADDHVNIRPQQFKKASPQRIPEAHKIPPENKTCCEAEATQYQYRWHFNVIFPPADPTSRSTLPFPNLKPNPILNVKLLQGSFLIFFSLLK